MSAVPFVPAVDAIVTGDELHLRALLQTHPGLTRERAPFTHRAALLHYVGANGVEVQRSPADTTLCLTVTSVHPYLAGVQATLVDVLADHGARIDGVAGDGAALGCALQFGYRRAAGRLVLRGARVDNLIYAAGLGLTDVVRQMLATGTGTDAIVRRTDERAGRGGMVDELLTRGADATVVDTQMNRTPAAWARERGHSAIAERLEQRG